MGLLDDTAIFAAIIQQGGFSHAARHLGLSNGMISRRIAQLEADLGVTLLKRTTRQVQLTPEGEVFWQHAQRIQQEMDAAVSLIQATAKKPKGIIRVSAPMYFGRHYLAPVILKFLEEFTDISVSLILDNQRIDPVKDQIDLAIRGAGYIDEKNLRDSNLQFKLLLREKIGLYASLEYLAKHGEPKSAADLSRHNILSYADGKQVGDRQKWKYLYAGEAGEIDVSARFNSNDVESSLHACSVGFGIGRFTDLHVKTMKYNKQLKPLLVDYDWGDYHLHAIYPQQKSLPRRTRLLLDFLASHTRHMNEKIS